MSQTDRLARIRRLFAERRAVSRQACSARSKSPATLKRDLAFLRDNMNTPIVWDRELAGYRIDPPKPSAHRSNCPACGSPTRRSTPCSPCSTCSPTSTPAASSRPTSPHCSSALTPSWAPPSTRRRSAQARAHRRHRQAQRQAHPLRSHRRRPAAAQTPDHPLLRARQGRRERTRDLPSAQALPRKLVSDAWCHLRSQVRNFAVDSIRRVQLLKTPPTTSRTPASTPSWVLATASSPVPPSTPPACASAPNALAGWPQNTGIPINTAVSTPMATTCLKFPTPTTVNC